MNAEECGFYWSDTRSTCDLPAGHPEGMHTRGRCPMCGNSVYHHTLDCAWRGGVPAGDTGFTRPAVLDPGPKDVRKLRPVQVAEPEDRSASQVKNRPQDQPLPLPGREDVQEALIGLIRERRALGVQRYGSPLMTHNGRDAVQDALEEALDLSSYLMQVSIEVADLKRELERERQLSAGSSRSVACLEADVLRLRQALDAERAAVAAERCRRAQADARVAVMERQTNFLTKALEGAHEDSFPRLACGHWSGCGCEALKGDGDE